MIELFPELKSHSTIIFDWNGTLVNDLSITVSIVAQQLSEHGVKPLSVEEFQKRSYFPLQDFYRELGMPVDQVDFSKITRSYAQNYQSRKNEWVLFDGVLELLKDLKKANKRVFILSASKEPVLHDGIHHFNLWPYFNAAYGLLQDHKICKVDRGLQLIEDHSIDPKEAVMIGDTEHDYEVAQAIGCDALLLSGHGYQHGDRLRKLHHRVFERSSKGSGTQTYNSGASDL